MKKLLFISNRIFWPPYGGHEVEIYNYCKGLHEMYGYNIDIYAFKNNEEDNISSKPFFCRKIFFAENINIKDKISNIITKSLNKKNFWPLQCSLYYNEKNYKKIKSIIEEEDYDVIIVDMVRLAPYVKAFDNTNAKKILDVDDMLSKRYKRQLLKLNVNTSIAGQYNRRLPRVIQKIIKVNWVKKFILKLEIPRIEKAEQVYSDMYDNLIFVSRLETEEYNKKYNSSKAITVGMGVDYNYFSEEMVVNKIPGMVTFVGNMETAANADSAQYIIDEILNKSKKINQIMLVGKCPDYLLEKYKNNNKVLFVGMVNDIRKYIEQGEVFLAPIAYGTGIKTKILEAMAMGMPVVTNSIGAEGIHGKNMEHWYVSDDEYEIAGYVDLLLEDSNKRKQMSQAAREFIENNFQWNIMLKEFGKIGL